MLSADPEFARGVALHDAGSFWDAHEAWESIWRVETDRERRRFLQGLIQVSAAFHKLFVMGDAASAKRILARALVKLDPFEFGFEGVPTAKFVKMARGCLVALEKGRDAIVVPRFR